MILIGDDTVSPHLKKEVKGCKFIVFKSNPYHVTYYWIGLLPKIFMTFRISFYDIPSRNLGRSKSTCPYGKG